MKHIISKPPAGSPAWLSTPTCANDFRPSLAVAQVHLVLYVVHIVSTTTLGNNQITSVEIKCLKCMSPIDINLPYVHHPKSSIVYFHGREYPRAEHRILLCYEIIRYCQTFNHHWTFLHGVHVWPFAGQTKEVIHMVCNTAGGSVLSL